MKFYCDKCGQEVIFPTFVEHIIGKGKLLCETCIEAQYFTCPGCRNEYHKSEGTMLPCFNNCKGGCDDCTGGHIWVCEGCADAEGVL